MRLARIFALTSSTAACVVAGCASSAAPPTPPPPPAAASAASPAVADAAVDAADDAPSLATLAGRQSELAPGLVESTRAELRPGVPWPLASPERDGCLRVLFASSVMARVWLETDGVPSPDAGAAREGAIGERGTVCFRRGAKLRLVSDAATRVVVFTSTMPRDAG